MVHPALATGAPTVLFNVRYRPSEVIDARTYDRYRNAYATDRPTTHVRIISSSFPWALDIGLQRDRWITCSDVWRALYHALQEPITTSEWVLLVKSASRRRGGSDEERQRNIGNAVASRAERPEDGEGAFAKRIDWLGKDTIFLGLAYDQQMIESHRLPGTPPCIDTYVAKFARLAV